DADAALPFVVRRGDRTGFRVGTVNDVVLDVDAAQPAELIPRGQRLERLRIEDLDAVVRAIGDKQAALRIEREAVRLIEFSVEARALLAELLDELPGLVEQDQPRVRAAMSFSDEDVAVRIGDDVVR